MEKHYLVMWKDDSWTNWETQIHDNPNSAQTHIGRLHSMHYDQIRMYKAELSMVYNHTPEKVVAR